MNLKRITSLIERTFRNDYDNNLTQIEEEDRRRKEEIKKTNARVDNLILSSGDSTPEVVDARGSHNILGNRLNAMQEEIETNAQYIETENAFDISNIEPHFFTNLNLYESSVLQCMVVDEVTGLIYASQVANDTDFTITRMSKSGSFMDHMKIPLGGHGSTFGLQNLNGNAYIWSNRHKVDGNGNVIGHELIRFRYVPNTTLTQYTTYNKFKDVYMTPIVDQHNKYIAFRFTPSDKVTYLELRRLTDVQNGVDNLLGRIDIPADLAYMQGASIDGYDLYWYSGDTNSVEYPNEITQYSFTDGQIKKRFTVDFGKGPNDKYEDNFREPESIFLYKDQKTGAKSLFAGVVTGGQGKRINKIYAYHQKENKGKFTNNVLEHAQLFPFSNGTDAKGIPEDIRTLSKFDRPGHYYMTTAEALQFTDHPYPGDAGWFMNVSPKGPFGPFTQEFIRNSTGRVPKYGLRVVNKEGETSPMLEFTSNSELEWIDLPLKNGARNVGGSDSAPLQFAINGGIIQLKGNVVLPTGPDEMIFATIPNGYAPARTMHYVVPVAGTTGYQRIHVRSEGELACFGAVMNTPASYSHTYVDIMYFY